MDRWLASDSDWLGNELEAVTDVLEVLRPSEWAERTRYLPPSVTALPGYFSFDVAPYTREILDCLSPESPGREISWMKGVQICATTAVLENGIGYWMDAVGTAPMMLLTADAELAKLRLESYVMPMIQHSGLSHLITSADEQNTRNTGKTDKKIQWVGGGFLIPFGAQNANKLRSVSIQVLLRDEIDGYPDIVGKDGDPIKLSADRTAAYEASRKILDISTPLIKGQSKIHQRFLGGDQRYYFVRCLKCNWPQTLRWRRTNKDTGEITGITWETENGHLVGESDEIGRDAAFALLFFRKLAVGRACRVDGEALGIPYIGQVGDKTQAVDEFFTRLSAPSDPEHDHPSETLFKISGRQAVRGIFLQAGIPDPVDRWVAPKRLCDLHGIIAVSLHTQGKSLDSLETSMHCQG